MKPLRRAIAPLGQSLSRAVLAPGWTVSLGLLAFAGVPAGLAAQSMPAPPTVVSPEVRIGPDTATNEKMAAFWVAGFRQLDPTRQLKVRLVRDGQVEEWGPVVELVASDSLLLMTIGLQQSGRRRVLVRADDLVSIEESASPR